MSNLIKVGKKSVIGNLSRKVPVKSIMSTNRIESKRQVLGLYKKWIRAVPDMMIAFKLPYTEQIVKNRIREEFYKNSHLTDLRVIDLLIIKSQMDLQETLEHWKQSCHVMEYFDKPTDVEQPTSFMGKFLTQKH